MKNEEKFQDGSPRTRGTRPSEIIRVICGQDRELLLVFKRRSQAADDDFKFAGFGDEFAFGIHEGEVGRGELEGDGAGLAGRELDFLEGAEGRLTSKGRS
jgi:hypothetical protein